MSTQRATNEALKAWMASRPEEEQQVVALKMFVSAHASQARFDSAKRRIEVHDSDPKIVARVTPHFRAITFVSWPAISSLAHTWAHSMCRRTRCAFR